MQSITASTPAGLEFLRVVNWCCDVGECGNSIHTTVMGEQHTIRVRLPKDDPRIVRLLAQVSERKIWKVMLDPSPLNGRC